MYACTYLWKHELFTFLLNKRDWKKPPVHRATANANRMLRQPKLVRLLRVIASAPLEGFLVVVVVGLGEGLAVVVVDWPGCCVVVSGTAVGTTGGFWSQLSVVQVVQLVIFTLLIQPLQKVVLRNVHPRPYARNPVSVLFGYIRAAWNRKHWNAVPLPCVSVGLSGLNASWVSLTIVALHSTIGPIFSHSSKLCELRQFRHFNAMPFANTSTKMNATTV